MIAYSNYQNQKKITMKNTFNYAVAFVICATMFASCQKNYSGSAEKNAGEISTEAASVKPQIKLASRADLQKSFDRLKSLLPADFEARTNALKSKLNLLHPQYAEFLKQRLNKAQAACTVDNLPLTAYVDNLYKDWDLLEILFYIYYGDIPTYYALLMENSSDNQYFDVNGEYTTKLNHTFRDIKKFWDINSSDILLVGMHFNIYENTEKLIPFVEFWFEVDNETARLIAEEMAYLAKNEPLLRLEDGAFFTFNAFANTFYGQEVEGLGLIPDKIVMGDGIMQGMAAIGFGDVAPQAILAHEFAHHIQFENNYFESGPRTPEKTRRTELMADAFAAYFLTHKRGATLNWKRVQMFLGAFFNIGDCSVLSTGHHGTPAQRMAAAQWGYNLANTAHSQGKILPSATVFQRFEEALPSILAN